MQVIMMLMLVMVMVVIKGCCLQTPTTLRRPCNRQRHPEPRVEREGVTPLGDDDRAPAAKRRRGSAIDQWREAHPSVPMPIQMPIATGWANQLTCSLAQLLRSTRGCSSTKVFGGQRSVKGGIVTGATNGGWLLGWASRQDEDEDEDERTAARRETRVPSFYLVIPDFRPGSNPPPPSLHLEHLRKGRGSSLLLSIGEAAVVV